MKIGIIGNGVVGNATARSYMEHAEVRVYDVIPEKATHSLGDVINSDIVFICLPSPQESTGLGCDTHLIENLFGVLKNTIDNYVLKSTVPIGFTRRMGIKYGLPNLVHSPEFLTARCAVTDAQLPARNIIGGPPGSGECYEVLENLYRKRFPGIQVIHMTSDESEAVKLFQNSFFAVKVAFFNEINQLADRLGLDWDTVREGMLTDGRIAHSHTTVPGPDGQYGFGGTCLPKDLANVTAILIDAGLARGFIGNLVCHAALNRNIEDRKRRVEDDV